MSFLKRIAASIWSLTSPRENDSSDRADDSAHTTMPTRAPQPDRVSKSSGLHDIRSATMQDLTAAAKSMSPSERVVNWRKRPAVRRDSVLGRTEGKRRREESESAERKAKRGRLEPDGMYDNDEYEDEATGDARSGIAQDDYDDEERMSQDQEMDEEDERPRYRYRTRSPYTQTSSSYDQRSVSFLQDESNQEGDMSFNTSLLVADDSLQPTPPRRRVVNLPASQFLDESISTASLLAKDWDQSYIALLQRIALRGREPLLPQLFFLEYRYLPPILFAASSDSAFLSSMNGRHFHAGKAMSTLFDLGSHVRDRLALDDPTRSPENVVRKAVKSYVKWTYKDSGFHPWPRSAIPLLATVYAPSTVSPSILRDLATRKCRGLASRWFEALRIHRSVEISPGSDSTATTQPLPTIFALVCSRTMVALMAFDPKRERGLEGEVCSPMAYFDFGDADYDVWNGLALGVVGCHVRNELVAWRESAGIGEFERWEMEEEESDTDA